MKKNACLFFCLSAVFSFGEASPFIKDVYLTIGPGWAVVRELRHLTITNLESNLVVDQIPLEADLSTLAVRGSRQAMELKSWERVLDPIKTDQVRCLLKAEETGVHWSQWIYVVTGVWWQAKYEMLLRGNLESEEETISADLIGSIALSNTTSRSFNEAKIQLVGADVPREKPLNQSGFLMMDEESPLSDLWKKEPLQKEMQHVYQLPQPVTISAREHKWVRFLSALRRPAERLYQWNTADYTFTVRGLGQPFRHILVLKNSESHGLGDALPAGDAQFYWGGGRSALLRDASFAHTPPGGEIRIDLGVIDQIRGERKRVAKGDPVAGFYEESYVLQIENQLAVSVLLEVLDVPHTALEWNMVKANTPYELQGRTIKFLKRADPNHVLRIEYTVRIREPVI